MPKIAISYRRADTEVIAGRICDRLADRYGENAVFMDIDNIPFGKDFRVHISEAIIRSDILLVIVGERWLGAGRGGVRKNDDETDFVLLEVETAMNNAVPIIPVLVGSARMPQPAQLPESLKNFAFLNAAPVDTGRDFREHIERLIRSIEQISPDRGAVSPAASGPREEAVPPTAPARGDRDADPKRLAAILTADLVRLRGFFNLRAVGTIVCIAIVAALLPRSLAPFLQFREKDKVALDMSQAPAADSRALAAPPTGQAASQIGEPIFFEKGKVVLSEAARLAIDRQAAFLRDNPKVAVSIEGHCSADEGSREGPAVLAQLRANQVRNALREHGIAESRTQAIGHADTKAAIVGDSEASQAQNRRVDVLRN